MRREPDGASDGRVRRTPLHSTSWNREPSTGYKVILIPFEAQGKAPMPTSTTTATTFPYETVFGDGDTTGPIDGS